MDSRVVLTGLTLSCALLTSCATEQPAAPPARRDPCALLAAPAPGPKAAERAHATALKQAQLFIEEGRETRDAGFYALAELAASCALSQAAGDPEASLVHATALYHNHRFAEAETECAALTVRRGRGEDWICLGDAAMEQGKLDAAADAYQKAADSGTGPQIYDRISYLRWLWGDVVGAVEMSDLAVHESLGDAKLAAWNLAWRGWLAALQGQPADALDQALALDPAQHEARLYRARLRLSQGDAAGALADLDATPADFAATRIRHEIDPSVDLAAICDRDPRGCALAIARERPDEALRLLDGELKNRQDAATRLARAWVMSLSGADVGEEVKAALASGTVDPENLYLAGLSTGDKALLQRALDMGPGLLPSQRVAAEAVVNAP